jgi:catechol 2,3-dioxygenase-like lactoylglutathione lyase family enzyme
MPNLENLRKQAKLYLRWHRDGHYTVAVQIRAVLPRFHGLDDRQVLAHEFRLADAQELVARQNGFESWQALKSGVHAVSDKTDTATAKPTLIAAEPNVVVRDFAIGQAFYKDKLGFETVFVYGEPPFYGQFRRGAALVNLHLVCDPVYVEGIREREEILAVPFNVGTAADIRALFVEFQTAGVDVFQTLRQEPWGARTFIVRDPDGNLLLFAGTAR